MMIVETLRYLQELFDGITKYFEKIEEENGYALTFDNF